MSSDIEFGDVKHAEPKRGVRPDQDAHFYVVPVGRPSKKKNAETESEDPDDRIAEPYDGNVLRDIPDDDLLIYVDLDVIRDMEAHAISNTRVELGGVMLGYQQVDSRGRPFVVVTESLRAEHYEATKGSFKFTHDTWGQITDQRAEFHPELEMVGWYHTHPGWSVFLSGMDLFICNNFFNRPLDVALVIDPVAHDRGWFQWSDGNGQKATRQTNQFLLMSSRFRQDEVDYFAKLYRDGPMADPRYSSQNSFGSSQPVVNLVDNRRPILDMALLAMLAVQFVLLTLIVWKVVSPDVPTQNVAENAPDNQLVARQQAYEEVLQTIVNSETNGPNQVVKNYVDMKAENRRLLANLDAQISHIEKVNEERDLLKTNLTDQSRLSNDLARQLTEVNAKIAKLEKTAKTNSTDSDQETGGDGEQTGSLWWWIGGGALGAGLIATIGFLFGQKRGKFSAYQELEDMAGPDKKALPLAEDVSNQNDDSDVKDDTTNPTSINFTGD